MKCKNCGREISPDAVFCDFCGSKVELASNHLYCGKCGAEITDGSAFCGNCGAPVADNTAGQQVADEHKKKSRSNKTVILVVTIILLVALIAGLLTGFLLYAGAGKKKDVQNNTSTNKPVVQTEQPASENTEEAATEAPLPTVAPTEYTAPAVQSRSMTNNGYYSYVNSKYGFSCLYPSWFEVSRYDEEMLSCNSPDGEIEVDAYCYESDGSSPSAALEGYIATCGGAVDYQSSGKNYYAVRIAYPRIYRYTYAHYKNGMVYYFMVAFTISRFNEADAMVNYIYNSFSAQFK